MSMVFAWTTLHVGDLSKSLAFYRDIAGMQVVDQYRIEEVNEEIAVLQQPGGGRLELVGKPGFVLDITPQENFSLAFEVDDAKSVMQQAGCECTAVFDIGGGTTFNFTTDPDGYQINLIERKG